MSSKSEQLDGVTERANKKALSALSALKSNVLTTANLSGALTKDLTQAAAAAGGSTFKSAVAPLICLLKVYSDADAVRKRRCSALLKDHRRFRSSFQSRPFAADYEAATNVGQADLLTSIATSALAPAHNSGQHRADLYPAAEGTLEDRLELIFNVGEIIAASLPNVHPSVHYFGPALGLARQGVKRFSRSPASSPIPTAVGAFDAFDAFAGAARDVFVRVHTIRENFEPKPNDRLIPYDAAAGVVSDLEKLALKTAAWSAAGVEKRALRIAARCLPWGPVSDAK